MKLVLMQDNLFTSGFYPIFFLAYQRTGYVSCEGQKKTTSAPDDQMVDPLASLYFVNCIVCPDIEIVVGEPPSRHHTETIYQDWSLEITTSYTTSRKALRLIVRLPVILNRSIRFLNIHEYLPVTDFDRAIIYDR